MDCGNHTQQLNTSDAVVDSTEHRMMALVNPNTKPMPTRNRRFWDRLYLSFLVEPALHEMALVGVEEGRFLFAYLSDHFVTAASELAAR